jgi:putative N6-adenine-specific DNA methylase
MAGTTYTGGVTFAGGQRQLYQANLHLRTASRVLVRVGEFYAAAFAELRKKASRLAWELYLRPGQPVAIHTSCHKSKLYHSDAVAERVAGAVGDRLGQAPAIQLGSLEAVTPTVQLVVVRLVRDLCTISVDASGALLHQRGYRLATAKAPLRETLAAGMLLAAGWNRRAPLLDPFCGSGTIAIEAALLAQHLAPGRARRFAFMDWPDYQATLWQHVLDEAEAGIVTSGRPRIMASDRDAGAIDASQANAARAGVTAAIEFSRRPISAVEPPPEPGWVVTNPPYGLRLGGQHDLRNLYAQFGQVLRQRCAGWRVAFLSADARLQHSTGLHFDDVRTLALSNGGLRVNLVQAEVTSGVVAP